MPYHERPRLVTAQSTFELASLAEASLAEGNADYLDIGPVRDQSQAAARRPTKHALPVLLDHRLDLATSQQRGAKP